jgi:dipeptidyl aminopeptidase/acylaminoacyl peptidase
VPGSGTAAALPVATPVPATRAPAAPAAVPTLTPSVTPEPINVEELTIDWLRAQAIPGSEITVEEGLAPGANYNRYLVSYLSDGLRIYAYMTIPQGTRPATGWPAIVFNHGYIPPTIYRSTERYIAYTDGFARNGYVVFRPDYRGHGFSDGEARGAYSTPDYVIDVLNALESVKNHPEVDPERIGMWGHSMGGYITMRAMVVRDDIKAGVIWAGVVGSYTDLLENWRRNPSTIPASIPTNRRRWREQLVEEFGTPEQNPAAWNSISANAYLDELSGPVQFHHGTADSSVPHVLSELSDEQVRAAGQISQYFEYAGDDHNLSASFYTAMQRSVAFFDQYVKNAN